MTRAIFLALGTFLIILGLQGLIIDRAVLRWYDPPPVANMPFVTPPTTGPAKQFLPGPAIPWTLMATGAITCIWSYTLPQRAAGK